MKFLFIALFSFSIFASNIKVDYRPYYPINCAEKNSDHVNVIKPFTAIDAGEEIILIIQAYHGKCVDGEFQAYQYKFEYYDVDVLSEDLFWPWNYPAEAGLHIKSEESIAGLITVHLNKERMFKKKNEIKFDLYFVYEDWALIGSNSMREFVWDMTVIKENDSYEILFSYQH